MSITTIVPVIDTNLMHRNIHVEGPTEFTIRQIPSTSYSQNNATFNCPPPSLTTFIDRAIYMSLPITITSIGTGSSTMMITGYDALRAYPIHSIINSIQMTINDRTFTIQANEIIHPTSHYRKAGTWSLSPEYIDKYQNYVDGVAGNNNPLGTYLDSMNPNFQLRGSFPSTVVHTSTTQSVMTCTPVEPLYIPPLIDESESALGFSNVNAMSFVINYSPVLSRCFSHATSTSTISSVSVTLGQPILYFRYSTPPSYYVPRPLTYGSQSINYFTTPAATLTSNSTTTIASTNVQLSVVPSHMYIFCREANANLTYASSDTYASIESINITFNNKTGILGSASKYDLFQIAKENNLQDTYPEYSGVVNSATMGISIGSVGGVLKLCFGKNIPLNDVRVGQSGSYNMQMNVTVKNCNQSASITTPTLYIVTVSSAKFTIDVGGVTDLQIGMLPDSDGQYVPYDSIRKYYGGSFKDFIGKVAKFFKPIIKTLKDTKLISTIAKEIPHPIAQKVGQFADKFGFGYSGSGLVGGRTIIAPSGGMVMGGAGMNRAELIERIKNF